MAKRSGVQQSAPTYQGPHAAASPPAGPLDGQWTIPVDTAAALRSKPRATVAFPPCADELLALIRTHERDEITRSFNDYFKFRRHKMIGQGETGNELDQMLYLELDQKLLNCPAETTPATVAIQMAKPVWPTECCLCSPCVTLDGIRNHPLDYQPTLSGIRRLFIGDVVWLFYYEQMGIHQILGAILDAYAGNGRLPISNGTIDLGSVRDDITALILEVMVRQTKMGLSSGVRDRAMLFRTTLGWHSKLGRALNPDTEVNAGFSTLFHRFIYNALEFYRDKRLAVAIQGMSAAVGRPSVATLVTLRNTIDVLQKRFEPFDYGRNYYNTLAGIVWTIAAMSIIRELRGTLGIPSAYGDPHEFIPAAYDLLILKRPVTRGDVNPYSVHRDCAINGRDILLDLQVLNHESDQQVEAWLGLIEGKIEAYRTAYRNLTGVDLGASASPVIEQQVPATA